MKRFHLLPYSPLPHALAAAEKTQTAALDTSLRACMVLTFVRRHPPRVQEALAYLQGADELAVSESLQVLVGLVDPQQVCLCR